MKINKPILFLIPALFIKELDKYLLKNPPSFKFKRVNFYYIIHYIITKQLKYKDKEYISLNQKFLKTISVSNIGSYIKILQNGEFIISDNLPKKGQKSTGFKLNKKFLLGLEIFEVLSGSKLYDKIIKRQRLKRSHFNRLQPFLKVMKDEFIKIDFDYDEAFKWVRENIPTKKQIFHFSALNQIQDKRFRYFHRNSTNRRLDTNFTNLKSELRRFIRGEHIIIDLKNSQPFFLSILISNINKTDSILYSVSFNYLNIFEAFGIKRIKRVLLIRQNAKKWNLANLWSYQNSVKKGTLYEDFVAAYPGEISRKEAKKIMFKVLFSRNEIYRNYYRFVPYQKEKEVFASVYPEIAEIVEILKEKNHSQLAIYLQKLESFIFIDRIARRLVESGIVPMTVHDSVIIKAAQQTEALKIIKSVFVEYFEVIPTFHIELLT